MPDELLRDIIIFCSSSSLRPLLAKVLGKLVPFMDAVKHLLLRHHNSQSDLVSIGQMPYEVLIYEAPSRGHIQEGAQWKHYIELVRILSDSSMFLS
jgi:hypothetical protein